MALIPNILQALTPDLSSSQMKIPAPFVNANPVDMTLEPLSIKKPEDQEMIFFMSHSDELFLLEEPEKEELSHDEPTQVLQPILMPIFFDSLDASQEVKKIPEVSLPVIKTIEKIVLSISETTHLSHKESIVYLKPHSIFDGLIINLEFFDTNPMSIKIDFQGHPQPIKKLSSSIESLGQILKNQFPAIDFSMISLSLTPLMPTGFNLQKSENKVSQKKAAQRKIVFKSIKATL